MAGVVQAAYDPVTATSAWRGRIGTAMRYYATRPGKDKDREEREAKERGHPQVRGRWFVTSDGEKIPLREAEERFLAQVEARREAALERKAAREAELTERYGRRIRLPDPVQRVYRVVISTKWAILHDRDVTEILGRAFGGLAGAAVGSAVHAVRTEVRAQQREARLEERRAERAAAREQERADRQERVAEARRADRQARADQRFAAQFVYARHSNTDHPHIHALAITDGRGLDVRDLARFRDHVTEKELLREREQAPQRSQERDQGRGRERER